jgi:hypothetical protein
LAVQYVVSPGFSKVMEPVPLPQLNPVHVNGVDVRLMVLIRTLPVLETLMLTMSSVPEGQRAAATAQSGMDDTGTNGSMVWAAWFHTCNVLAAAADKVQRSNLPASPASQLI